MNKFFHLGSLGISQFFQMPFNVSLARRLPIPLLRIYLYFWGIVYVLLRIKICTNIFLCLSYIYQAGVNRSFFIVDLILSIQGVFEHYFEKLVMAYKDLEEVSSYVSDRLTIKNRHLLDELSERGQGAILVTGHFGAVEYLPLSLALSGYKVAMICKFKTESLKEALKKRASFFGVELIDASESGVVFKAIRAIKEGRFLITECDEFSQWRLHKTQRVSVFGRSVPRDRTLDFFVKKANVPTFLILMKRNRGRFSMEIEALKVLDRSSSISVVAWKRLEEYIFSYPFQWYQIKGAAEFLMENEIEEVDYKKDKDISDKDSVFSPSFT